MGKMYRRHEDLIQQVPKDVDVKLEKLKKDFNAGVNKNIEYKLATRYDQTIAELIERKLDQELELKRWRIESNAWKIVVRI